MNLPQETKRMKEAESSCHKRRALRWPTQRAAMIDATRCSEQCNALRQTTRRFPATDTWYFQQQTHCSSTSGTTISNNPCTDSRLSEQKGSAAKKHFQSADATIINCQRNSLQLPMQRLSTAGATHFTERKSVQLIGEQHKRATHAFAPRPTEDTFHLTSQYCPHTNFQPREMTSKPPVPYIYTRAPANGDRYKDKDIAKALPKKCCGRTLAINFN